MYVYESVCVWFERKPAELQTHTYRQLKERRREGKIDKDRQIDREKHRETQRDREETEKRQTETDRDRQRRQTETETCIRVVYYNIIYTLIISKYRKIDQLAAFVCMEAIFIYCIYEYPMPVAK